jgi:aminopeptidase-like protein
VVGTVVDGSILEPRMLNSVSVLRAFDFRIYSSIERGVCLSTLDLGVISISDKVYATFTDYTVCNREHLLRYTLYAPRGAVTLYRHTLA